MSGSEGMLFVLGPTFVFVVTAAALARAGGPVQPLRTLTRPLRRRIRRLRQGRSWGGRVIG